MLEDINWISVGFAILGSVLTAATIMGGFLITWGRIQQAIKGHDQKVAEHDKRLDCSNGKLDKQARKDWDLQAELKAIKDRCSSRESLWRRNNDDHVELFSRINALEKGFAAMPGQMAEMIDKRFEKWQVIWKQDIKATIYEVDREKMKR